MADRLIRIILQAGVILAVIAALPYKIFELDRYFVAKELVLNVAALVVALLLLARRRSLWFNVADGLLALFLIWSAASALFATNHWVAQRSLGVTVSGAVIFWGARSAAERGLYRPILVAAAIASVLRGRPSPSHRRMGWRRSTSARTGPPVARLETGTSWHTWRRLACRRSCGALSLPAVPSGRYSARSERPCSGRRWCYPDRERHGWLFWLQCSFC